MDKALVIKEKRPFQKGDVDNDYDVMLPQKRPKVSSGFMESLFMKAFAQGPVNLQICAMIEPMLRNIVSEEMENKLLKFVASNGRMSLPRRIKCADPRTLRLHFKNKLPKYIFTQANVKDEQGDPVCIELQDRATGKVVTTGQESAAKLEVVVLEGDFSDDESEDWCQEDFELHVVKEHKGKGPLLKGNLTTTLKEGLGTLGDFVFTDNSSHTNNATFRLGVELIAELSGLSILEGKSEAFRVKDCRGAGDIKHYPPAPNDDVWRLKNIKRGGSYAKTLEKIGVKTVRQFCISFSEDPQKLRDTLGTRISNKALQDILAHAQTCAFSDKAVESLTDKDKVYEEQLVKEMYETSSKIDSSKMPISEKLDELRGAGGRRKESRPAIQYCSGNHVTSTRHAVQDQQSDQYHPFFPSDLWLSEPVINIPTYSSHGFVVSPDEASTWVKSTCSSPRYPLPDQMSPGELNEFLAGLDNILDNNTKQDEIGDNQELAQMHSSCMTGTLNLPGEAVSVVGQSFGLSSADNKGCSLPNSSSRLRTFFAVSAVVRVSLLVREHTERARKKTTIWNNSAVNQVQI